VGRIEHPQGEYACARLRRFSTPGTSRGWCNPRIYNLCKVTPVALQIWICECAVQEKDVNTIIGKNIRIRRSLKGYSQTAVAELLGIRFQQVQKYEKGSNIVSPAKLLQLSQIFGCGVEDLFRDPAQDKNTLASIPGHRVLHLVQNFERLGSETLQQQICDLVRTFADLSTPDREKP
jgi:transcriptional regulator with XRE-family HTH domain